MFKPQLSATILTLLMCSCGNGNEPSSDRPELTTPPPEEVTSGVKPRKSKTPRHHNDRKSRSGAPQNKPEGLPPGEYELQPTTFAASQSLQQIGETLANELALQPRSYYSLSPFLGYSWMPGNCWPQLDDSMELTPLLGQSFVLTAIVVEKPETASLASGRLSVKVGSTKKVLPFSLERQHCDFSF